jgi:hypothetical protein
MGRSEWGNKQYFILGLTVDEKRRSLAIGYMGSRIDITGEKSQVKEKRT